MIMTQITHLSEQSQNADQHVTAEQMKSIIKYAKKMNANL